MSYICKNCGHIVSEAEYQRNKQTRENAMGCGCFIWIIILLCFVSLILIPLAIILLGMAYDKQPENECPYCHSKNCLIPDNTPIGKKMIEENYSVEEIKKVEIQSNQLISKQKKKPSGCAITFWIIIAYFLIAIILGICGVEPPK